TAGNWSTVYHERSTDGFPMCVMTGKASSGGFLMVKYSNERFFVDLSKASWKIPINTEVNVSVQLDSEAARNGTAVARSRSMSLPAIDLIISIPDDKVKGYLESFAAASRATVSFLQGNEPTWTVDLTGTREAMTAFNRCVSGLPAPTQPFGN